MTRASDTARLLGAGATILDGTTISTADNTDQLTLLSTDADATTGPNLRFYRNSASPADNDGTGQIQFEANNDAGEVVVFNDIQSKITDASDGTEDGTARFRNIVGGTLRDYMLTNGTETVFNEGSVDLDFRVESNGNANMLFVNGGTDRVGIGTNSPARTVQIVDSAATPYLSIVGPNDSGAGIMLGDTDDETVGRITYDNSDNGMQFWTNDAQRMKIDSSGNLLVGQTSGDNDDLGFHALSGGTHRCGMASNGDDVLRLNRKSSDGIIVRIKQDNSTEGNISVSGTTVTFNGGHLGRWSQLADNSRDNTIVKGTVMTNLDQMAEWKHEDVLWTEDDKLPVYTEDDTIPDGKSVGDAKVSVGDVRTPAYTEDNEQLNCMAVSSVEGDANVAGVLVNWDNDDKEHTGDMNIAMTGDMVIRIAKDTTVSRGDLLMSAGDGTAKPQGDDIVKSKTIAKVTSTNKSHTYDDGTYLVPCVLMAC